jgi:heme/copper-type cytochrome/quinol oxidase subunit 2
MADWLAQIAEGAVSNGVNFATFVALNVALLLVIICLIFLLGLTLASEAHAALTPHVVVFILLAIGLWALMIWLIGVVGITETVQAEETQPVDEQGTQEAVSKSQKTD